MSDNKQSSIEWLIGQLKAQYDIDIEQAKAMHKEETIKFAEDWEKSNLDCKEDLYNETFNSDEA